MINKSNPVDYSKFWSPAFDTMDDFVFLIDKDFNIVNINNSFLNFTKGKKTDFLGKKCHEIVHEQYSPINECPHKITIETGKFASSEFYEPKLKKWLYVRTTPIFDDAGKLLGSIHLAADISDRKKSETDLSKRITELERFQRITIDRELRMKELKSKIAKLERKIGPANKNE